MLLTPVENEIGKERCRERGYHLCTANCIKLRINSKDKSASNPQDNAVANACGKNVIIPLEFAMLDSEMPYYQSGLRNRYVMKSHSKLLMCQDKHQPQVPHIRSKISP